LAKVDGLPHAQQVKKFLVVTFRPPSKVLKHGEDISQMIKEKLVNAMIPLVQGKNNKRKKFIISSMIKI